MTRCNPFPPRRKGYRVLVAHISDDDLERYAMRTLPADDLKRLAAHVRICSECRDRLEQTEQFVAAMRAAAAQVREEQTEK